MNGTQRGYLIDYLVGSPSKVEMTRPGERHLMCWVVPPWQRDVVWTDEQQVRFVEGIFLGLGCGYYVVHEADWTEGDNGEAVQKPMSGYLLDGQQRLTSIDRFVRDELTIFDGLRYSDLDWTTRRRRFLTVPFPCFEIPYQEDENLLKTLYDRLCFGGTPHTQAVRGDPRCDQFDRPTECLPTRRS